MVIEIKLNNAQICPEVAPGDNAFRHFNGNAKCAKFEMTGDGVGGRYDGVLTIYPQQPRNGIRVDVELDQPAWAFGVINNLRT